MKKRLARGLSTFLLLCAVVSAFYLREQSQPKAVMPPVSRVLAVMPAVTPSPSPCGAYRQRREAQRQAAFAALNARIAAGDEAARAMFDQLLANSETELAVEGALAGLGCPEGICAMTDGAVSLYAGKALTPAEARTLIEMCERLTGVAAERIFILD